MRNFLCLVIVLSACFFSNNASAQDKQFKKKNAVGIEAGGLGWLGSAFYERIFYQKDNVGIACRVGAVPMPYSERGEGRIDNHIGWSAYVAPKLLIKSGRHVFDGGIALSVLTDRLSSKYFEATSVVIPFSGYRYYFWKEHLFLGASFQVMFILDNGYYETFANDSRIMPWGGLSFGYSF